MNIQEINVTNNQKKAIKSAFKKRKSLMIEEENGDLVIEYAAYEDFIDDTGKAPIEEIIGDGILTYDADYLVFIS
ncbi:hypothetical protein [Bermanella sp. R86510]|uniref:hypothetical protein n=1 Tax=unclassified Bermanella TaxID=2627862 RepID=UPI0037CB338E